MQANSMAKASVSRWKQLLGGMFVCLLLLPVPAYAAITNFTWLAPQTTGQTAFVDFDAQTTGEQGSLVLTFVDSINFTSDATWSITATFDVVDEFTILTGKWEHLDHFQIVSGPGMHIAVTQGANNMFGAEGTLYSTTPPGSEQQLSNADLAVGGPYSVTITFTFLAGTFMTSSSTESSVFPTLTLKQAD